MRCVICQKNFEGRLNALTCSSACRQRRYREVGVKLPFKLIYRAAGMPKGSCVPISISNAVGKSQFVILEWLQKVREKKTKRPPKSGWLRSESEPILRQLGFKLVTVKGPWLLSTLTIDPSRTYIVFFNGHAVSIINGVLCDTWNSQKKYLKRFMQLWIME